MSSELDAYDPEAEVEQYRYGRKEDYASAILGEFVRSYGIKRDKHTGDWGWSVDNIGTAFKEHPFWTSIDYLALGVAPARFGITAYSLTRGAKMGLPVGKALRAGHFAKEGRSAFGELRTAVHTAYQAPARTRVGRLVQSPLQLLAGRGSKGEDYWSLLEMTDAERSLGANLGAKVAEDFKYGHDLGVWNRRSGQEMTDAIVSQGLEMEDAGKLLTPELFESDRHGIAALRIREKRAQQAGIKRRVSTLLALSGRVKDRQVSASILGEPAQTMGEKELIYKLLEKDPTGQFPRDLNESLTLMAETTAFDEAKQLLSPEGSRLYEATFDFRNAVHEEAYRLGFISQDTYEQNLHRYMPRLYEEYLGLGEDVLQVRNVRRAPGKQGGSAVSRGTERYYPRGPQSQSLTRSFDPSVGIEELGYASMVLAQHRFAEALGKSVLAKDTADVVARFGSVATALENGWGRLKDYFPGKGAAGPSRRLTRLRDAQKLQGNEIRRHVELQEYARGLIKGQIGKLDAMQQRRVAKLVEREPFASWALGPGTQKLKKGSVPRIRTEQQVTDLLAEMQRTGEGRTSLGERLKNQLELQGQRLEKRRGALTRQIDEEIARKTQPRMLKKIPLSLSEKWIDPLVAEDLKSILSDEPLNMFRAWYDASLGFFKSAHTSLNPATHARNTLGNIVFHSFANGKLRSPRHGFNALRDFENGIKGRDAAWVDRALNAGLLSGSRDAEAQKALRASYGWGDARIGRVTSMDWLTRRLRGDGIGQFLGEGTAKTLAGKVAARLESGAAKAERLYAREDEVWKLDAFIRLGKKYEAQGMSIDEATAKATMDVFKSFPNYLQTSPLTEMISAHLPFVSFATEGARVFSNVLREKPHWAFFWNHFTESASQAFAAMHGMPQDELESARESLPWYTQQKKMLLLPWKDSDGKPHFLDLSYIIPLADMGAEADQAEQSFFGVPIPKLINPATNPFGQIFASMVTGKDPFTGRPVEPRFLQEQAGVYIDNKGGRFAFGLGEHFLRTMLPPLVPPGYVGTNLIETMRGQKSGYTNQEVEPNAIRTVLMNLAGMRTYEPTVTAQLQNIKHEQKLAGDQTSYYWDAWELAIANGDLKQAEESRRRIEEIKDKQLGAGRGTQWFMDNMTSHVPGSYRNLSSKDIAEVLNRSRKFKTTSSEITPIYLRYLETRRKRR